VTARQSRLVDRGGLSISSDSSSQSSAESLACSGPNNSVTAPMNADNSLSSLCIWSVYAELENDSFMFIGYSLISALARSKRLGSTKRNQSSPQTRSRRMRDRPRFDVRDNVDVAVGGFGIWTFLVRGVHQRLGDFAIYTREVDVEASLNEVTAAGRAQIHFGVNGDLSR